MKTLYPRLAWIGAMAIALGLTPGFAWAQRGNRAPAPPEPPPAAVPGPAAQLFESGATGWLGISTSEVTPDIAKEMKLSDMHGALVTVVGPDTPAAKAGLAVGDIITEFQAQRVEGTALSHGWSGRRLPVGP
jgi:hypothetical protein